MSVLSHKGCSALTLKSMLGSIMTCLTARMTSFSRSSLYMIVINSLDYLILIFAALVAAYLDVFFFSPYKNSLGKEIYHDECDLRTASDVDGVEMKVKTMEVKAYRYAYMEFAKKGVVALFLMIASLALSVAEKSFSIPNIIFYTCLSLLLYQSLTPLFGYDTRLEENLLCKARVNNIVHQDEIDRKHE